MIDLKTLNVLEYDKILLKIRECAVSQRAKAEILNIVPSDDFDEVVKLQALTKEAYEISYKYLLNPIVEFDAVDEILQKAKVGACLQMGELLRVARVLRSARIAKKTILSSGTDIVYLKKIVEYMSPNELLENLINESIASEFEMKDDASDKLKSLRRKIIVTGNKLKDKLAGYTKSNEVSKFLQDNLVTVRNGRFVLPVKSESRSGVPGLVHDQSASGSTVFIEPFVIVEMNNELRTLQIEESQEIERILQVLSDNVSNCSESIIFCQEHITALDIVFSKCAYSIMMRGESPIINNSGYVNLKNARHPLIDDTKVVPIDVIVGGDQNILLVTGPNTGGKTVCLKTVGLFSLMACSGLMLPCDGNSEVSVFEDIYCDIGDEQSITQSLSTFSSHILNIVKITEKITPKSLVLLDELGAGTDPIEGAALAIGILKYIELIGSVGVITTHYSELKEYALISKNIMNACMQFDEKTLKPTFKVMLGIPGVSNALKIAKNLGLNEYILKNAYENLNEEKVRFEQVLQNAETVKSEAIKEKENLQILRSELEAKNIKLEFERKNLSEKLEKINANARLETKRLVSASLDKADELIANIKEQMHIANEKSLIQAWQYRKQLENMQYDMETEIEKPNYEAINIEKLKIGQTVVVISLNSVGIVKSLPNKKNEISVAIGSITTNISVNNLGNLIDTDKKQKQLKTNIVTTKRETASLVIEEVRVLGLTVSEAVEILEPHIYNAFNGPNKVLKIIHGKGTGALSKGIHAYLKSCNMVFGFRFGKYGEGDNGVTIAEMK